MIDGSHDDEQLLARFGQWLREARAEAGQFEQNGSAAPLRSSMPIADIGLSRLVEEFTALRHEVKLQTRSSRALQDQAEALSGALQQAIDALRSIEPKEAQAAWSAGKALATVLAELDDSLDRGRQQTEKAVAQLIEQNDSAAEMAIDFHTGQSLFTRLLHGRYHRRLLAWMNQAADPLPRLALLEALLDGYRLIQKRLVQSLATEGILRIETVGRPVEPELMVVVDVVDSDELPGGVVYDELRRGYTWKGRVLRYAEVRATRAIG